MTQPEIVTAFRAARKAALWLQDGNAIDTELGNLAVDAESLMLALLGSLGDDTRMSADGAPGTPLFASRRTAAA